MDQPGILVIDGEQGIRDLVEATFASGGQRVLSAETAQAGLELVRRERPDLVLLDIRLPDKSGLEVLRRIRAIDPQIVVVMITGHAQIVTCVESLRCGAYDYVEKPIQVTALRHLVGRGLERRRLVFEKERLMGQLEEANRELEGKKLRLEQRVIVTEKRLSRAEEKLGTRLEELTRHYEQILSQPVSVWERIGRWYSKYMSWLVVPSLIAGILASKFSPAVMQFTNAVMGKLIDGILLLAPLAIFIVLAPSVAKIIKTRKESRFAGFVVLWFSMTRVLAALWAAIFVTLVLGLPILPQGTDMGIGALLIDNLKFLGDMMLNSTFFRAMWFSVAIGIAANFSKKLYGFLQKGAQGIESGGGYIEPWIPLFAFMIGGYIYGLPQVLAREIPPEVLANLASGITLMGFHINLQHEFGLVGVYFIEALLIGLGCFIWQAGELGIMKFMLKDFSIKAFMKDYWIKIYPLAWATSSEAISMPLNMSLIKRRYQEVRETVRRLVVGLGGYLNINGTSMDVMMLTGVVSVIVGHPASFFALLLSIPIIALIGYGVPGIAGEELLFLVPMMSIIGIPDPLIGAFVAIFSAIQLGLPDSFRTGANVTDNGIYAIGLNRLYIRKYETESEGKRVA